MAEPAGPRQGFFDLWSRFYDLAPVQAAVYRPVHEAVLEELRSPMARRVLDVGCGTGNLTERIARELHPELAAGCDFSYGMLEQAAAKDAGRWWVQGDALRLPVRDESVDAVVSTESFHWFPDHDAALAEFHRVLAPSGRVLVALINPRIHLTSRAVRAGSQLVGEPAYWPTRQEMAERLHAAGFDVAHQRRVMRVAGLLLPTVLTVGVKGPR